jgi:hypothetical protein
MITKLISKPKKNSQRNLKDKNMITRLIDLKNQSVRYLNGYDQENDRNLKYLKRKQNFEFRDQENS